MRLGIEVNQQRWPGIRVPAPRQIECRSRFADPALLIENSHPHRRILRIPTLYRAYFSLSIESFSSTAAALLFGRRMFFAWSFSRSAFMPHLMNTYGRLPVAFSHGQVVGCRRAGQVLPGSLAGISGKYLGPQSPRLVKHLASSRPFSCMCRPVIASARLKRLPIVSPRFRHGRGVLLQLGLRGQRGRNQARTDYGHQQGIEQPASLSWSRLSTDARCDAFRTGTARCRPASSRCLGFWAGAFDDLAAIEQLAERNPNVVAVLFEPIQGEGGITLRTRFHACAEADLRPQELAVHGRRGAMRIGRTGVWFAQSACRHSS